MTLLPLLYPKNFDEDVYLLHEPLGTGKILFARALTTSYRADGRQVCTYFPADQRIPLTPLTTSLFHAQTASPSESAKPSVSYSSFLRKHVTLRPPSYFSMRPTDWHPRGHLSRARSDACVDRQHPSSDNGWDEWARASYGSNESPWHTRPRSQETEPASIMNFILDCLVWRRGKTFCVL